jgi:hypothetical protein
MMIKQRYQRNFNQEESELLKQGLPYSNERRWFTRWAGDKLQFRRMLNFQCIYMVKLTELDGKLSASAIYSLDSMDPHKAIPEVEKLINRLIKKRSSDKVFHKEIYPMNDYEAWDHIIYQAGKNFFTQHQLWPSLLIANPTTLEAIDTFMTEKLLKEGRVTSAQKLTEFRCSRFHLKICLDPKIPDREFALIYDSEIQTEGAK